jgi:hypothetical protein
MRKSKLLFAGILFLGLLIFWIGWQLTSRELAPTRSTHQPQSPLRTKPAFDDARNLTNESQTNPSPQQSPTPSAMPEDRQLVFDAIDNLEFTFRDYANALGGNPVGTNAEITAALQGDNPNQLKLETPGGSSVNRNSELCDPWGTPWFFHQLSASKMEIRSAGPDRVLYSEDDYVR